MSHLSRMEPKKEYEARTMCGRVTGYEDLMVVELNERMKVTSRHINEMLAAIAGMPGQAPLILLLKVPEGTDICPRALQGKAPSASPLASRISAFAIVTKNRLFTQIAQIYLAYHRCTVPSAIFHSWEDACFWSTGMRATRPV